jgi:hypothetical protein
MEGYREPFPATPGGGKSEMPLILKGPSQPESPRVFLRLGDVEREVTGADDAEVAHEAARMINAHAVAPSPMQAIMEEIANASALPGPSRGETAVTPSLAGALAKAPPPVLCIGLGLLKDGRHVAFEADVQGRTVKAWRPLCARPQVDGPERAWWQVGFAKLCAKRELLPAERMANERDSAGVRPEHFAEGAAVAIVSAGRTLTGLAFHLEGTTVQEPRVVGRGAREFCWSELAVWAALNMLPRRRKS